MSDMLRCISPVDGRVYAERKPADFSAIEKVLGRAQRAQKEWAKVHLKDRQKILERAVGLFVAKGTEIAEELTWQMGRPIAYSPGEIRGFEERAKHMIDIAPSALQDLQVGDKEGFTRFIQRTPLGVVLVIAPWNYPYLTAVNSIIPALLSGNTVILKHSTQTLLCAERFAEMFSKADLPEGVFQILHINHDALPALVEGFGAKNRGVDFIAFTGSVAAGHSIQKIAAKRFIGVGLELGGKDPAYVRPDANLDYAIENLVDGSFFNSGQSCCGIERIYVHEKIYDTFVEGFVDLVKNYRLGDPINPETTLGPMVRASAAEFVRKQVEEAIQKGAKALINPSLFPKDEPGTSYLAPQVLVDVSHVMKIMKEETFGPAVGIMKVKSDSEAIKLMNDSDFGLSASIWTEDENVAIQIGNEIETGTWFMNRCDYLDPALAWVGVKESGRGCSLSQVGFDQLTRPKSFHLKTKLQ